MFDKLSVIEIPYYDPFEWVVDLQDPNRKISSVCKPYDKHREIDDYETCGLYYKAGVPYTRERLEYYSADHPDEEAYIGFTRLLSDKCTEALKAGNAVFVTGGFCTYAPGAVGAIQRAFGDEKKIGIVWIDEHADICTPYRTRDELLAGMPLGTIVGAGMEPWRVSCGLNKAVDGRDVLISDYRQKSPDDDAIVEEYNVVTLDAAQFKDGACWKEAVEKLAERVDVIYLQIDADILSKDFVPCYDYPVPDGHDIDTVVRNASIVMNTGKVAVFSTTCFYFDTDVPGREVNTLSAMKVTGGTLASWKKTPAETLVK